jgi:hypothetical protein
LHGGFPQLLATPPPPHVSPSGQVFPQSMIAPHPSLTGPQFAFASAHVIGLHGPGPFASGPASGVTNCPDDPLLEPLSPASSVPFPKFESSPDDPHAKMTAANDEKTATYRSVERMLRPPAGYRRHVPTICTVLIKRPFRSEATRGED